MNSFWTPHCPPTCPGPPTAHAGVLPQAAARGLSHTPPLEGLVLTERGTLSRTTQSPPAVRDGPGSPHPPLGHGH